MLYAGSTDLPLHKATSMQISASLLKEQKHKRQKLSRITTTNKGYVHQILTYLY